LLFLLLLLLLCRLDVMLLLLLQLRLSDKLSGPASGLPACDCRSQSQRAALDTESLQSSLRKLRVVTSASAAAAMPMLL
jgi:hypothetical protein